MSDTGKDAASPSPSVNEQQQQQQQQQQAQRQPPPPPSPSSSSIPTTAPSFEPLFTLVTNSTTNATSHPRVRYLFSDDDPSIIQEQHQQDRGLREPASHRSIVVDLVPDASETGAWRVGWASSLDPDFAVTSSAVSVQQGEDGGATMLKLEGVEREPVDVAGSTAAEGVMRGSGSGQVAREDVEGLVEDFKRRMGVLGKVVTEGERRRAAMGEQDDMEQHLAGDGVGEMPHGSPGGNHKAAERPASKGNDV